jgi:selenocysteine-specific elongation factor
MRGDRFIIRDETAQRTIAGGVVILPAAPRHKRSDPALGGHLEAFASGDDAAFVEALLAETGEFAVQIDALSQLLNSTVEDTRMRLEQAPGIHLFDTDGGRHYASGRVCGAVKASLLDQLAAWHAAHPLSAGMDIEEARAGVRGQVPARIFRMLVQELADAGAVVREGNVLRVPGHRIAVPDADRPLVERITDLLGRTPLSPPDAKQLADELAVDRHKLTGIMRAMERQRSIVCVAPDLYFLREWVDRVKGELIAALSPKAGMTAAEFRDRYKTSRKYAIPLLEYFDREGVTIRMGETRRLRTPPAETA